MTMMNSDDDGYDRDAGSDAGDEHGQVGRRGGQVGRRRLSFFFMIYVFQLDWIGTRYSFWLLDTFILHALSSNI
jgi:hypothetical protein